MFPYQVIPCRRGCATSIVQSSIPIRHAHVLGIVAKAGRNPRPFYEKQQTGGGRGKNGAFAFAIDHRTCNAGLPVRSAVLKPCAGRLVVG